MSHIVIDSTTLDALLAAGDAQCRALKNLGCRCEHNVLYAGMQTEQLVTKQCARCKSMAEWERVKPLVERATAGSRAGVT